MPWPGRPMTGALSLGLGITVYASGMPFQKNNSSVFPGTNSLCIRWHGHPISSVLPPQAMTGLCKYGKRSKEESVNPSFSSTDIPGGQYTLGLMRSHKERDKTCKAA